MIPPLCQWILANEQQCAQFALRGRRFCHAHDKLARIEQTNRETRALIGEINSSGLRSLLLRLLDTLEAVIEHRVSPNRAHLIFQVSFQRCEDLLDEIPAAATPRPLATPKLEDLNATDRMIQDLTRMLSIESGVNNPKTHSTPLA
jgi:hypothetical protein